MTTGQAKKWASDSVYPGIIYHVTTVEAAAAIRQVGFDLHRRAGGRAWGDGVYGAIDHLTRDEYLGQLGRKGVALELRVALRRVLHLRIPFGDQRPPFEYVLAAIPEGLSRLVMARLVTASLSAALTHVMADAGYDAVEVVEDRFTRAVGGRQLVVFDPKRVVVLVDDDTRVR